MRASGLKFKSRKALALSFNWIFVMIIGAMILFLAIMFSGKLIKLGGYQQSAELLPAFETILNPFSSVGGLSKTINIQTETIMEFSCDSSEELGRQGIRAKTKGAFGKWSDFTDYDYNIYDKYIFSGTLQGKTFYAFGKTLNLPFKVDEMIYVLDKNYCFLGAPADIESEINDLGLENLKTSGCSEDDIKVCFNSNNCNINVKCSGNCEKGYVSKTENAQAEKSYFITNSLMYAAIFSSYDNYNCNFDRITERMKNIIEIYRKKADSLSVRGCDMGDEISLLADLNSKINSAKSASNDKSALYNSVKNLENANLNLECPIF